MWCASIELSGQVCQAVLAVKFCSLNYKWCGHEAKYRGHGTCSALPGCNVSIWVGGQGAGKQLQVFTEGSLKLKFTKFVSALGVVLTMNEESPRH